MIVDPHDLTPRQVLARRPNQGHQFTEPPHDPLLCGISPLGTCNECLYRWIAQDDWDRENDWRDSPRPTRPEDIVIYDPTIHTADCGKNDDCGLPLCHACLCRHNMRPRP